MLEALAARGWTVEASQATFYIWCRAPDGDDLGLTERLMRVGLVVTPGSWLGPGGEGYVRWALVPTLESCRAAATRLGHLE
jgi:aspartate/methionine/tyrosine aminotransferase